MSNHLNLDELRATVARLEELRAKATPGEWRWLSGYNASGDSVELLAAEVGTAGPDEDPEYAEVLFGQGEFGKSQVSANWALIAETHNALSTLLTAIEALLEERERLVEQQETDLRSTMEKRDV